MSIPDWRGEMMRRMAAIRIELYSIAHGNAPSSEENVKQSELLRREMVELERKVFGRPKLDNS